MRTNRHGLSWEILRVPALGERDVNALWNLYDRYYASADRTSFERDLREKSHVIVLRERRTGVVRGFSALRSYDARVGRRRVHVIYSGDTIVDRAYWGKNPLKRAFLLFMVQCKLARPFTPVYWLLVSKGYKTYLLLTRNFPVHWPRYDQNMPQWERRVRDELATQKFGRAYDPARGVVHYEICPGRLRDTVAPISSALLRADANVRFFVEANPGHAKGDELCCLGLVGPAQWVYFLGRPLRKRIAKLRGGSWRGRVSAQGAGSCMSFRAGTSTD